MAQHFLPGEPDVQVVLRRSARARRLSLRVSRLDGRVTLTLPEGVPEKEGLAFLYEKANWVSAQLAGRAETVRIGIGAEVLFEGRPMRVVQGNGRQVRLTSTEIMVPGDPDRAAARVQGFMKERARARLVAASDRYAARLGREYSRLTLRDTRSRWGSCSSRGALMF